MQSYAFHVGTHERPLRLLWILDASHKERGAATRQCGSVRCDAWETGDVPEHFGYSWHEDRLSGCSGQALFAPLHGFREPMTESMAMPPSIGKINHFSRAPRASISSHLTRVPTGRASQPPPHARAGCSGGHLAGLPPGAQRTTQA